MELRLIVGYVLLVIFLATLGGLAYRTWRQARDKFERRWGKQKPHLTPWWFR